MTATPSAVLKFAPDATLIDEANSIRIRRGEREMVLRFSGGEQEKFWRALRHGAEASERRRRLERLPPNGRLELLALVEELRRGSWIVDEFRSGDRVLLTRTLISDWYKAAHVDPAHGYALSRFALLRHHPEGLLIESPRCHARITLGPEAAAQCASLLAQGTAPGWDTDVETGAFVRILAECGLLVIRFPDGTTAEDHDANLRGWDFHDLLFHARSRAGRHRDPYGKIDPALQPQEVALHAPEPASRNRIVLPVPIPAEVARRDPSFDSVLEGRRTIRAAPSDPLTVGMLGEFLFRSARIQRLDDSTPAGSWRPFASAAGLNELDLYLNVQCCSGLAAGLYRYDAFDHALDPLEMTAEAGKLLAKYCSPVPFGVHVIVAARFAKINRRYHSLAYSLILRNAGCLLQTMYMVATALGRAPCAVGAGDADLFARVTGLPYEAEGSVADFVLR